MVSRTRDPSVLYPFGRPRQQREEAPKHRACEHPGCTAPGEYRAPKDRSLSSYVWLCLEHVREHNTRWNYYEGMSATQMEAELRQDTCWQRPTWKLGTLAGGTGGRFKVHPERVRDGFGLFDDEAAEARRARASAEARRRAAAASSEEEQAMRVLDIAPPFSREDLKARYYELVKIHHPDVNQGDPQAEERLKGINQAYKTLLGSLA